MTDCGFRIVDSIKGKIDLIFIPHSQSEIDLLPLFPLLIFGTKPARIFLI